MNEKNETQIMYPLESVAQLGKTYSGLISSPIESEDQLTSLLNEAKPALDAWFGKCECEVDDIIALVYSPPGFVYRLPGAPHFYHAPSHIVPIHSIHHRYIFKDIVRQLTDSSNISPEAGEELYSSDEAGIISPEGELVIYRIPYCVWEALPSNRSRLPLGDNHESILYTALTVIDWLKVHPFPDGWEWVYLL